MDIFLITNNYNEILEAYKKIYKIVIVPGIASLFFILMNFYIDKFFCKRYKFKIVHILFLVIIFISAITAIFFNNKVKFEPTTNKNSIYYNIIKANLYFFARTLPNMLFNINMVPEWSQSEFKKTLSHNNNIIFIIGESLTANNTSLFNYKIDTTPFLRKLKGNKNFIYSKAISSGVFTSISLPFLINTIKRPNAIKLIKSNKTSLYKLAKDNGYETYFFTIQEKKNIGHILKNCSLKYIDHIVFPNILKKYKFERTPDICLLDYLKSIDLNKGKKFIIMQMYGSHFPYEKKYPKEFKRYNTKNNEINNYNNSILYTDFVLMNIINYIEKNSKIETKLIFTSDHGEKVNKKYGFHCTLSERNVYEVPFFLYSFNSNIHNNIKRLYFKRYTTHYNISLLILYYLGYDSLKRYESKKAYVTNSRLDGSQGYLDIDYDENKGILKEKLFY